MNLLLRSCHHSVIINTVVFWIYGKGQVQFKQTSRIYGFRQVSPSVTSLEWNQGPERQMVFNLETEDRRAHLLKRQLWIQPGGWRVIKSLCLCDVSAALISPRKLFPCCCLVPAVASAWVTSPYDLRALPVGLQAESVKSFWRASCEADSPRKL